MRGSRSTTETDVWARLALCARVQLQCHSAVKCGGADSARGASTMPQKPKGNVTELTVTFCSDESLEIGGPDVDYARDHMKGLRTFLKEHSEGT